MLQQSLPHEAVVSIGVDWLTCTFEPRRNDKFVGEWVDRLLCEQRENGNMVHNWAGMGYKGLRSGEVQFGVREDSTLIRLSGVTAASHWRPLAVEARNISRLDLQVTSRISENVDALIIRNHGQAKRAKKRRGRGPTLTLIKQDVEGATLYVGKRTSNVMGRIYNKGAQSKDKAFERCIRHEVEFKDVRSCFLGKFMCGLSMERDFIGARVRDYFCERGCHLPAIASVWSQLTSAWIPEPSRPVADISDKLEWLRSQVKPTVQWLTSVGHSASVIDALGLSTDNFSH